MPRQLIYITGTDTGVGKTVATAVLALQWQRQGLRVGVIKPVQCAGNDAAWLKATLDLPDALDVINPIYAPEPLSPHLALRRARKKFDIRRVWQSIDHIGRACDVILLEGAGGLCVPLHDDYTNADLARDLGASIIIVARPGLGTINHTSLTIAAARSKGIDVRGIVFCTTKSGRASLAERTNPTEIGKLTGVPVLGVIPFLKKIDRRHLLLAHRALDGATALKGALSIADTTASLKRTDKKYIWHPFTQMQDWLADDDQPLIIARAKGVYLYDTQGESYIDGVSSLWVNLHGHGHPAIDRAIKEQLAHLSHSTFLGLSHPPAIQLAEQLIKIAPRGLSKVFYSDNGSTAVEIALKQAYQYFQNTGKPKKQTLVHLTNAYHGDTLGSVSVGGMDLFHHVYGGLTFKTHALPGQGWDTVEAFEKYLKKNAHTTTALIVEPLVQGAAGMLLWPRGVLKMFREICTRHDVFLIADEVATGFGRTGKMFACQHERVTPDFLCLAKGITGGYLPLAATLTTEKVYNGFMADYAAHKTFFHGHTYTANPLACAAALANLEVFRQERTLAALAPKIRYLTGALKAFTHHPRVKAVRQLGLMAAIELNDQSNPQQAAHVCQHARRHGIILRPLGNAIVLMPPLVIKTQEIDMIINALIASLKH